MNRYLTVTLFINLASCISTEQPKLADKSGQVQLKTHFYNLEGKQTFTDILRVWYKDSMAIEEIHKTKTVTDTANLTTVSYPVILYRYIDLRSKTLYDYKNLSDTAKVINKAVLPDSLMEDYGWSFYSEKAYRVKEKPEELSDTVIKNITYKRVKFNFPRDDPKENFLIGYYRCDNKGNLFSLEKSYSKKINCTMVKFYDFKAGESMPYASIEVDFVSDTLSGEELKIFDAWEQNARLNPVDR